MSNNNTDSSNSASSSSSSSTDQPDHKFKELFDKEIPINQKLAKEGKLNEAIDNLYTIEKQTRNAEDLAATREIALVIVSLCYELENWDALMRNLIVLSKRKSQLKEVVKSIVQEGIKLVDELLSKKHGIVNDLIDTLRKITEGKIFVENERARLTKTLSEIYEQEGNISKASKLLQTVQVETYGSMDQREKIKFLLEQTRLCLDCNDWIRAKIISNKISEKVLQKNEFQDLKILFRKLLIRYYTYKKNYLQICRSYLSIYETQLVLQKQQQKQKKNQTTTTEKTSCDESRSPSPSSHTPLKQKQSHKDHIYYLKMVCLFVCLAERSPEQSDLLHRVYRFKPLEDLIEFNRLLHSFITSELICWSRFTQIYRSTFEQLDVFSNSSSTSSSSSSSSTSSSSSSSSSKYSDELWKSLRDRVIEHNIRVISKYYTRISTKRFSQLLELNYDESEKHLSRLVVNKNVYARINRPKGIIAFRKPQQAPETLNNWSNDTSELLSLLEKTSHLIQRENMVFKVKHGLTQSQPL